MGALGGVRASSADVSPDRALREGRACSDPLRSEGRIDPPPRRRNIVANRNNVDACGLRPTISDKLMLPSKVNPAMSSGLK